MKKLVIAVAVVFMLAGCYGANTIVTGIIVEDDDGAVLFTIPITVEYTIWQTEVRCKK